MTFKAPDVGADGVAVWHARTVPELADAVRWLAGQLSQVEAPVPPDLSGYVPLADFQALEVDVTTLEGTVEALQGDVTTLQGQVATLSTDLTALEARVAALEPPADAPAGTTTRRSR